MMGNGAAFKSERSPETLTTPVQYILYMRPDSHSLPTVLLPLLLLLSPFAETEKQAAALAAATAAADAAKAGRILAERGVTGLQQLYSSASTILG
jgi:hypothetical protein